MDSQKNIIFIKCRDSRCNTGMFTTRNTRSASQQQPIHTKKAPKRIP